MPTRPIMQYTLTRTGISVCEYSSVSSSQLRLTIFNHECFSPCLMRSIERMHIVGEFHAPGLHVVPSDRASVRIFVQE